MLPAALLKPSLRRMLLALLCALGGCAHHQRCCVPTGLLVPEATVDLNFSAAPKKAVPARQLEGPIPAASSSNG